MRFTGVLEALGRPVVLYPGLVHSVGDVKAGVLLSALLSLYAESHNRKIPTSIDEIEALTGMSRKEQVNARKKLVNLGLVEYEYIRQDHRAFYTLVLEQIDYILRTKTGEKHSPKGTMGHSPKRTMPAEAQRDFRPEKSEFVDLINTNNTKTTTTTEGSSVDDGIEYIPAGEEFSHQSFVCNPKTTVEKDSVVGKRKQVEGIAPQTELQRDALEAIPRKATFTPGEHAQFVAYEKLLPSQTIAGLIDWARRKNYPESGAPKTVINMKKILGVLSRKKPEAEWRRYPRPLDDCITDPDDNGGYDVTVNLDN